MEPVKSNDNRIWHYDLLRILACFSVIMLHSAAQCWYILPVTHSSWLTANTYDGLFRFGVPIFVMISGALFLAPGRECSLKRLYTHNILRLVIVYVFWSLAYALWTAHHNPGLGQGWKAFLKLCIEARYHMWFIPMLIGIYMLLPILRILTAHAEKKILEYFLLLFVVCQILQQTALAFTASGTVTKALTLLPVEMAQSYLGYFILGYYLAHFPMKRAWHFRLYLAGFVSIIAGALLSNYLSVKSGVPNTLIYDSYSIFIFLGSAAIFLFFKEEVSRLRIGTRTGKVIRGISDCTLGIYLIHLMVMEGLYYLGFYSMSVNNLIGIPLLAVLCFVIGLMVIAMVRRIPLIGKRIC